MPQENWEEWEEIWYIGTSDGSHTAMSFLDPFQVQTGGPQAGAVPQPTQLPFVT